MWTCPKCKETNDDILTKCFRCYTNKVPRPSPFTSSEDASLNVPTVKQQDKETSYVTSIKKRYKDAYRKARATVAIGNLIKLISVLFAALSVIIGVGLIQDRRLYTYLTMGAGIGTIIIGVIGGAIMFIIGILVSAQGQTHMATLDCAVNSSPFLTDEQRAEIMSL